MIDNTNNSKYSINKSEIIDKTQNDIALERLNAACKLIYKKYNTDQFEKVDKTIFSSYKFDLKK